MPYEHERNTPLRAAYDQGAVPVLDFLIESGADKRQLAVEWRGNERESPPGKVAFFHGNNVIVQSIRIC